MNKSKLTKAEIDAFDEEAVLANLMMPRYKIIAPWPIMPGNFCMGKIFTLNKFSSGKWYHEYTDDEPIHLNEGCTTYSANLQLLAWYEDLPMDDMPLYIKTNYNFVYEVFGQALAIKCKGKLVEFLKEYNCVPATEKEFNECRY